MRAKFDNDNPNKINIFDDDDNLISFIAIPPTNKNNTDLLPLPGKRLTPNYNHNFDGWVILTTSYSRKLYRNGELEDKIRRDGIRLVNDENPVEWKIIEYLDDRGIRYVELTRVWARTKETALNNASVLLKNPEIAYSGYYDAREVEQNAPIIYTENQNYDYK